MSGHKNYLGFLYLEHTYNNSVANTFVALLTDDSDVKENRADYSLKCKQRATCNNLSREIGVLISAVSFLEVTIRTLYW